MAFKYKFNKALFDIVGLTKMLKSLIIHKPIMKYFRGKEIMIKFAADKSMTGMKTAIKAILYFFGLDENPIKIEHSDDMQAISQDWRNVGNDIRRAISLYRNAE